MTPGRKEREEGRVMIAIVVIMAIIAVLIVALASYEGARTIRELLLENKILKEALARLTQEDQIGYAKVIKQERRNGKLFTTLKFVETARDDKTRKILEREYAIEGDVIHFDALIVKFANHLVLDGQERSLYLWRRVYGETMPPAAGYPIEEHGKEPRRYEDLLAKLKLQDRETFWANIWDLANDPEKLRALGVQAIHGEAVYTQLKPGLIYVFKISNSGQLFPETVPEM